MLLMTTMKILQIYNQFNKHTPVLSQKQEMKFGVPA
jgi:hypothetical protein